MVTDRFLGSPVHSLSKIIEISANDCASEVVVETVDPEEAAAAEAEEHGKVNIEDGKEKAKNFFRATENDHNSEQQWYGKAAIFLDFVN